jgi:hypothetical protein
LTHLSLLFIYFFDFFLNLKVKSFVALAFARFEWCLTPPPTLEEKQAKQKGLGKEESSAFEQEVEVEVQIPAFEESRSGLGVYPPKHDINVYVRPRSS